MSDYCIVCADPLTFTAYGPCGHKETCSKCVSRLRSVLKDQRCAYCQQQCETVFVTHFAGDYTQQVGPDEFPELKARVDAGELYYLDSAQAYFDDSSHFQEIQNMCSFTHPLAGPGRIFHSMKGLKHHMAQTQKRQFCEICLEGRKVFVSEQMAYTRAELERHLRQGDLEGAMAESGFKGHPDCRFCKKRFYGENELYQHMHTTHEECFLCRRAAPNRHVYYRDYPDLDNHFKVDHYPCEHPHCLEQRFVVFPTEQELKTHTAREHGQTLTKAERKQALTLPVTLNYRRGGDQGSTSHPTGSSSTNNLAAFAAAVPGAVTMGGGAGLPARGSRHRHGSAPSLVQQHQQQQHSSEQQFQQQSQSQQQQQQSRPGSREAAAAGGAGGGGNINNNSNNNIGDTPSATAGNGLRGGGGAGPSSSSAGPHSRPGSSTSNSGHQQTQPFSESEFPSMGAPSGSSGASVYTGGRWVGAVGPGGGSLAPTEFPALPGTSKSAKKRTSKKKSAAEIVSGLGNVRVMNVSGGSGSGQNRGQGPAAFRGDIFPALGAVVQPSLAREEEEWQPVPRRTGNLPRPPSTQEIAEPAPPTRQGGRGGGAPGAGGVGSSGFVVGGAAAAVGVGAGSSRVRPSRAPIPSTQRPSLAAASVLTAAAEGNAASTSTGGVSEALRSANKLLIEKVKQRLGDDARFAEFKQQSVAWVKGEIPSQAYHAAVASLGLVSVVPELAATCPDAKKRNELLEVHATAFGPSTTTSGNSKGKGKKGSWMPPEAAAAAAAEAAAHSSWECSMCTLVNAPAAKVCEACGQFKPLAGDADNQWKQGGGGGAPSVSQSGGSWQCSVCTLANAADAKVCTACGQIKAHEGDIAENQQRQGGSASGSSLARSSAAAAAPQTPQTSAFPPLPFPPLPGPSSSGSSGASGSVGARNGGGGGSGSSKGKAPKGKQSLGSFMTGRAHTQNPWKNPALKGEWASAGAGKLAQEERAVNDAWTNSKK